MASALTAFQLESALKQQGVGRLYLIVGEEDLLRDRALSSIKSAVLGDGSEFNYDLFYGDETGGAEIGNCVSEMPVFAERRLVIVKAAEKLSAKEGEVLLGYVKEPVETTTLVFVSPKIDGRLKFSQALARMAVTIDCSPLRDAQVTPWIAREAQHLGIRLEEEAAQLLKEISGGSLYGVRRELEKLRSYIQVDRPATAVDVQVLRGMEPGASVFDLTVAIGEGDRGGALAILARNLEAGEASLRILGSLAWQYRRIWKVKESLALGNREGEAARTLRMDPMKVRAFVRRFSEEDLQSALRLLRETDGMLKGGGGGRPRMVMEQVLLRLCGSLRDRTRHLPDRHPRPSGRDPRRVRPNVRTIRSGNRTQP